MSTDANKALARRFIQVWVPGNLGLVDELAAPDITVSYPMLSEPVHGAVALKQILAHSHVGIPDLREVNQRTGKRGVACGRLITRGDSRSACRSAGPHSLNPGS